MGCGGPRLGTRLRKKRIRPPCARACKRVCVRLGVATRGAPKHFPNKFKGNGEGGPSQRAGQGTDRAEKDAGGLDETRNLERRPNDLGACPNRRLSNLFYVQKFLNGDCLIDDVADGGRDGRGRTRLCVDLDDSVSRELHQAAQRCIVGRARRRLAYRLQQRDRALGEKRRMVGCGCVSKHGTRLRHVCSLPALALAVRPRPRPRPRSRLDPRVR